MAEHPEGHDLTAWIGKSETHHDVLDIRPARYMQATVGRAGPLTTGDPLPPLWHWLYFVDARPPEDLGRDGHPKRGGFLPPVPLPRRMWAGGRFTFHAPLLIGAAVRKVSTIKDVVFKTGRTGPLCFVTVEHAFFDDADTELMREEHDILYREDPKPDAPKPAPPVAPKTAAWSEQVIPSPTLLFRYSAVTFNGHRIHYDPEYARTVEGYDGLVFHGPLTATLLVDLAERRMNRPLARFAFTAKSPLTGMDAFCIEGQPDGDEVQLWARREDGSLAMDAQAIYRKL